jgi:hypothetical protein
VTEAGVSRKGVEVAAGDVDGDGDDEIVAAVYTSANDTATIYVFGAAGVVSEFVVEAEGDNVNIAAGDIDFDGTMEIVVGNNARAGSSAVKVYNADGTFRGEFPAFDNVEINGVGVSLGQLMGE